MIGWRRSPIGHVGLAWAGITGVCILIPSEWAFLRRSREAASYAVYAAVSLALAGPGMEWSTAVPWG
jgi:hypothetical protein